MLCLEEPANEEVACGIKERNERHDSPRILPNWAGAPKAPQRSEPCAPESKKKKKKSQATSFFKMDRPVLLLPQKSSTLFKRNQSPFIAHMPRPLISSYTASPRNGSTNLPRLGSNSKTLHAKQNRYAGQAQPKGLSVCNL